MKGLRQWLSAISIVGCVVVNTVPRELPHIPSKEYGDFFCRMQALSFLLLAIGARSKGNSRQVIILWEWVMGLTFNNFYNEMWGYPYEPGKTELSVVVLITLCTLIRLITCKKKTVS